MVIAPDKVELWAQPEGQIAVTTVEALRALERGMVSGKTLVPRPLGPIPAVDGLTVTVPICPAGTRIEVFDLSGDERMYLEVDADDGFSETFNFPDPGLYEVETEAPEPYLPTSVRLEVTS
mgnify:CR=1 FL=1